MSSFILEIRYAVVENMFQGSNHIVMLINNLTDHKNKERELVLKSVAISEIHHRIKNNLQTIASLLKLQSRRIDDQEAKEAFNESISRVLSIATTHNVLAENGVDSIDIISMLNRLKDCFMDNNPLTCGNVKFYLEGGDSFPIDSDKATSVAIVVNEVVQNTLKHAFHGMDNGEISIKKIHRGSSYSNITISDNGNGYDVHTEKPSSLGYKIIQRIIEDKMKGRLTVKSSKKGTLVSFDFPYGNGEIAAKKNV